MGASSVEAMDKLLADPEKYLNSATLLMKHLRGCIPVPVHCSVIIEKAGLELALGGNCPVTLSFDPSSPECTVPGSSDWQVQLGGCLYRMVNKAAWLAFL